MSRRPRWPSCADPRRPTGPSTSSPMINQRWSRRFLHAAEAGRAAQAAAVEGRAGEDLRGAVGELRAATARLAQAAGKVLSKAGKAAGAVPGRLGEVASSSVLGEQLARHRLGFGGDDVDTDALFAGLELPATPAEKPARAVIEGKRHRRGAHRKRTRSPRPTPAGSARPSGPDGPNAGSGRRSWPRPSGCRRRHRPPLTEPLLGWPRPRPRWRRPRRRWTTPSNASPTPNAPSPRPERPSRPPTEVCASLHPAARVLDRSYTEGRVPLHRHLIDAARRQLLARRASRVEPLT